jgi:hypothetical protein
VALNDDEGHAFAGHLDGVRVPKLMRCEPSPHASARGGLAQFRARAGLAGRDAQQRTDRELDTRGEPGLEFVPGPVVHADLTATAALAATHQHRAAPRIEVRLAEWERLVASVGGVALALVAR